MRPRARSAAVVRLSVPKALLAILITSSLVAGSQLRPEPAAARPAASSLSDVETAIERANVSYASALERGDAAAFASLFTEDAVDLPAHAAVIHGREAIRDAMAAAFAGMTFSFAEIKTSETHLSGDSAFEFGTYRFDVTFGGRPHTLRGRYAAVWRRVGDDWKIALDASQPDAP